MTCKEELILYWQDQVGPDSEEDKARGAAIGALHWEMMQSYERMIERVTQVQAFFKRAADTGPLSSAKFRCSSCTRMCSRC